MLGFPVGVSRNRKTPCWLLKGVYVCERVSVCFWMSLLTANSINPRCASLRFQTSKRDSSKSKKTGIAAQTGCVAAVFED